MGGAPTDWQLSATVEAPTPSLAVAGPAKRRYCFAWSIGGHIRVAGGLLSSRPYAHADLDLVDPTCIPPANKKRIH
jgi:hypothetical protein